jgi:hypothetical protein
MTVFQVFVKGNGHFNFLPASLGLHRIDRFDILTSRRMPLNLREIGVCFPHSCNSSKMAKLGISWSNSNISPIPMTRLCSTLANHYYPHNNQGIPAH